MRKIYLYIIGTSILLCLAGCWDQMLLKDTNLIFVVGIDQTDEQKIKSTVSIPQTTQENNNQPVSKIASGIGNTLRESRMDMNTKVSGMIDSSQLRVLLVHDDLASLDLYSMLDLFYRDPRAPLNAKIVISESLASELVNLKVEGRPLVSKYLEELIQGAEIDTLVPEVNIQNICPIMLDEGKDIILPLISVDKSEKQEQFARIIGNGLFNGKRKTGELNLEESVMANLLDNQYGKRAQFNVKVNNDRGGMTALNYITLEVEGFKRNLNVNVSNRKDIEVKLELSLYLNVIEYPPDNLGERQKAKELNEIIAKELTNLANTTVSKLQEANCDYLGIGRQIIAYHNYAWEDGMWNEKYPNIPIDVTVNAEIRHHGIIN